MSLKKLRKGYKPPYRYCNLSQTVFDAYNTSVCDIRGYGHLQHRVDKPEVVQDQMGEKIAELLNSELDNTN